MKSGHMAHLARAWLMVVLLLAAAGAGAGAAQGGGPTDFVYLPVVMKYYSDFNPTGLWGQVTEGDVPVAGVRMSSKPSWRGLAW
jgi:hypothetical protein